MPGTEDEDQDRVKERAGRANETSLPKSRTALVVAGVFDVAEVFNPYAATMAEAIVTSIGSKTLDRQLSSVFGRMSIRPAMREVKAEPC